MSKQEEVIKDLLLAHKIDFIQNDVSVIEPYELDFYIPSLNVGIEINSLYHHSMQLGDNKSALYHFDKSSSCARKKIKLLHIWSNELEDTKRLWKYAIHFLMIALNIAKVSNFNKKSFLKTVELSEIQAFITRNRYEEFELKEHYQYKAIFTNQRIQALLIYEIVDKTLIIHNYCTLIFHKFDQGFKFIVNALLIEHELHKAEIILDRDKYSDVDNFALSAGFKLDDSFESEPLIVSEDFNSIVGCSENPEEDLKSGKRLLYTSGKSKYIL